MRDAASEHHDLGQPELGEELAGRHAKGYFDVPRFIEQDESLLRLIDNPKAVEVIEAVMRPRAGEPDPGSHRAGRGGQRVHLVGESALPSSFAQSDFSFATI